MAKEWEKFEKIPAWQLTKVSNKERGDWWSKNVGHKSSFCIINWHICLLKNAELKANHQHIKFELYSEVTQWMMIQDHTQYLLNKDHQHHKRQPQKSWTLFQDYQDAHDTQQTQYPAYTKVKWKMDQRYWISKVRVSRHLDSSTTTQMAKIMVQYGRSGCSSWTKSLRSLFGRTIMGKAIWENPFETWLGENS